MNETSNMATQANALYAEKVSLKSVGNKEYFTLEVEQVFRPYLPEDCSGVTE
jgi:hypothetical protein